MQCCLMAVCCCPFCQEPTTLARMSLQSPSTGSKRQLWLTDPFNSWGRKLLNEEQKGNAWDGYLNKRTFLSSYERRPFLSQPRRKEYFAIISHIAYVSIFYYKCLRFYVFIEENTCSYELSLRMSGWHNCLYAYGLILHWSQRVGLGEYLSPTPDDILCLSDATVQSFIQIFILLRFYIEMLFYVAL